MFFLLFLVVAELTYDSSMAILRVLAEPVGHFVLPGNAEDAANAS